MSKDHNSPEWYCLVHCIEIPQNKDPLEKYKMIIHPQNEKKNIITLLQLKWCWKDGWPFNLNF